MQIKNQEQAFKLQEEFKARLLQSVEALRKGKAPPLDAMLKDRDKLVARAQARLDQAMKEREAVLRHWDERIARLKGEVEQLEAGTQEIKTRVTEAQPVKTGPKYAAPKKKKK
jgi:hypothetical protein